METYDGLVHDLDRHCAPPPHFLLHDVYSLQVDQPPSTGEGGFDPSLTHSPNMHHWEKILVNEVIKNLCTLTLHAIESWYLKGKFTYSKTRSRGRFFIFRHENFNLNQ